MRTRPDWVFYCHWPNLPPPTPSATGKHMIQANDLWFLAQRDLGLNLLNIRAHLRRVGRRTCFNGCNGNYLCTTVVLNNTNSTGHDVCLQNTRPKPGSVIKRCGFPNMGLLRFVDWAGIEKKNVKQVYARTKVMLPVRDGYRICETGGLGTPRAIAHRLELAKTKVNQPPCPGEESHLADAEATNVSVSEFPAMASVVELTEVRPPRAAYFGPYPELGACAPVNETMHSGGSVSCFRTLPAAKHIFA
mmetsp:Transcript_17739/g.45854  ORF Transcript_17739/g.45854 Transcript_17739/m.45854 type:complete len:247 (+) Transcript_17739:2-742(+)